MTSPSYKFQFRIVDEATGQMVESDYCSLGDIDQGGSCANVDIHVGQMLRNWRNFAREEYERVEYGATEDHAVEVEHQQGGAL